MAKYVGILTAGGDSPGLNAAIRGVAKAAAGAYDDAWPDIHLTPDQAAQAHRQCDTAAVGQQPIRRPQFQHQRPQKTLPHPSFWKSAPDESILLGSRPVPTVIGSLSKPDNTTGPSKKGKRLFVA